MTHRADMTPQVRRDFWLCVGNGAFYVMGSAFFAYETIMAGLAFELTHSTALVGLMTSLAAIGWFWPQLFVGGYVEHLPRKLPVYIASILVRCAALAFMLAGLLTFHRSPMAVYWALLAGTALYSFGGGVCMIPFMDIVAKLVPEEHRHMLFAYRRLFGGILGFAAGLIAAWLLTEHAPMEFAGMGPVVLRYPYNYAILFALALVLHVLGYLLFLRAEEPEGASTGGRVPFREYLRRGPEIFRADRAFRRYYYFRVFIACAMATEALITPWLMATFKAPLRDTGWLAATITAGLSLSSLVWGRLSQRYGVVALLRASALTLIFPGAILLAVNSMLSVFDVPAAANLLHALYLPIAIVLLAIQAAGRNAMEIGGAVYILALPPPGRRPTYMAFMNTLIAPLTLFPALAGLLAQYSYNAAFAAASAGGAMALIMALRLRHA